MNLPDFERKPTRPVTFGEVVVGGSAPVTVQSMCNTDTRDAASTIAQIERLEAAGCEIVRVSVYDADCARALREIKRRIHIPLVADVHFDYRLAIAALQNGADKLRINPGNIGSKAHVQELVAAAKDVGAPIRIGVNGGSLEKELLRKYGAPTPEALAESALGHVAILEEAKFFDIVLSVKASSTPAMIAANRILSVQTNYPLHLGVTEAGLGEEALVKSAVGIGALLSEGIGDTIRVSITGDPVQEVTAGLSILRALGLRKTGVEIVSCPTCGRCRVDLAAVVQQVKQALKGIEAPLTVAVMGCVVNGPGEAKEADIGIAFAPGGCMLFKKGKLLASSHDRAAGVERLKEEARALAKERQTCSGGR